VHPRQHLALLLSMAAFGSTGAWASDIQCATTRQPAERVICDHAILNNEYDDIVAQQQALRREAIARTTCPVEAIAQRVH